MTYDGWRLMSEGDLADICRIADICHPDFPEDAVVLDRKRQLSPQSCFVLDLDNKPAGYLIAHPWLLKELPALNTMIDDIPAGSNTLYLHDLALLPQARSSGWAREGVQHFFNAANMLNLEAASLVAVNRSSPFWEKMGFVMQLPDRKIIQKLLSYSEDAIYMVKMFS